MKKDACPLFGVRSGAPVIGLGLLIILFAIVPLVMPGMVPLPVPIGIIFVGFGLFLIWLGVTR